MLMHRIVVIALLMVGANFASAQPNQTTLSTAQVTKGANFAQHKQKAIDHINARIQIDQNLLSCVQAANDHAAMKACHDTAKQSMQSLHNKR